MKAGRISHGTVPVHGALSGMSDCRSRGRKLKSKLGHMEIDHFCGHSVPSPCSRRAVVSYWRKYAHKLLLFFFFFFKCALFSHCIMLFLFQLFYSFFKSLVGKDVVVELKNDLRYM